MEFFPAGEGEEAGLALFLSSEFYYTFFVRRRKGELQLVLEKRADDFHETAVEIPVPESAVTLRVEADRERYVFLWAGPGGLSREIASASTRFLACEVAGRSFTGVMAGLYAGGNGAERSPAYFDYFLLEPRGQ